MYMRNTTVKPCVSDLPTVVNITGHRGSIRLIWGQLSSGIAGAALVCSILATHPAVLAKSGKVVGGTAAVGAILGGIFGGGKGAAIGAVSGAGAGAAVQFLTKGQRVKIPAETRLSFTLQNAIKI